jgi:hypothetical protein
VEGRVFGLEADGFGEGADGFVNFVLVEEGVAQVVMRVGRVRLVGKGCPALFFGLFELLPPGENLGQIIPRGPGVGILGDIVTPEGFGVPYQALIPPGEEGEGEKKKKKKKDEGQGLRGARRVAQHRLATTRAINLGRARYWK